MTLPPIDRRVVSVSIEEMEENGDQNPQGLETSAQNPSEPQDTDPTEAKPAAAALDRKEILKALEVVERDSVAIAESYASLFSSLRLALSEVSSVMSVAFWI